MRKYAHWPVHEIEIKIVDLEILQCLVQSSLDILRCMMRVPELAGDPDVGPRHAAAADALADLNLVPIYGGTVDAIPRQSEVSTAVCPLFQTYWRYPACRAASTAAPTSPGLACQVPKPTAGILAPVLRVKDVSSTILCD